jgi:diguanylate cyclase (GGDEF)-like protein/PAS domain S-box-containing protein
VASTRTLVRFGSFVGLVGLVLGFVGVLPAAEAVAIGVGTSSVAFSWVLIGRRPCRPIGLVGFGVLIGGLSAVGAGLAHWLAPDAMAVDVPLPAEIPLVGLFFTAGMYLLGMLLVPGAASTFAGRLRRCLDAVGIAVCVFFTAWLLLFAQAGLRGAALTAVLVATILGSVMVIVSVRLLGYRPIAVLAGAGPTLSVIGLMSLTVALDYYASSGWVLLSGTLLVAGPILTWHGARAARGSRRQPPPDTDGSYAGYPLLMLPLAGALLAAAYHFIAQRRFDSISIMLSIAGVAIVALREALGAMDVRRYAARLAAQEAHFRFLVIGSTDVTIVLDADLLVRWQSPAAARQLGLSDQEVVGRPLLSLVHPDDVEAVAARLEEAGDGLVEVRLRDGFGAWRDTEWSLSDQRSSAAVGALVVHVRDVSERKELQRTLHRSAYVDQLTGLANRRELSRAIGGRSGVGALMVVGLAGVAGVNDVRGHDVGDAVLVEAARRLRAGVAPGDLLARLNGDKFAVATQGGAVQAQLLATRLLTMLTEPYEVAGAPAHLSANVGLAELNGEGHDTESRGADEALRRAELALHRASRQGRGGVEWYDTSLEGALRRRLAIEQELPGVVARGELDLVYQPVIELATRRPVGAEALLRWRHPTLGAVPPAEFIPIAEELGILGGIGDWVLHRACRQLSGWLRDDRDVWMSVNMSPGQLAAPAFVATVALALEAHQVPAARLMLEVAEAGLTGSAGRADPAADATAQAIASHLTELRSSGVRIVVDQFGAASTSLSQLRLLPVDLLKVDRRLFTEPAGHAGPATAIIDVIVKLSGQIGVEVVAHGVESEADIDAARAAGCQLGQGYVLSRPAPPERLEAYLDGHQAPRFG